MNSDYKIATSYVRTTLQADPSFLSRLDEALVTKLATAMNSDYIDGALINLLFEQVASQGVVSWADQYGSQIGVGNHGPLGFAALSAPNLQTAVEIFVEFIETRTSGVSASLEVHKDRYDVVLINRTGSELAGRWLIESTFLAVKGLIETIMAHPLGQQSGIHFKRSRDLYGENTESMFSVPCLFDQPDNRLCLPASWMQVPSPLYDEQAFRSNLRKVREIKLKLSTDKNDVTFRVRTQLLNHFDQQQTGNSHETAVPSLETLAEEFGMSPRTLIRKLARQDTTYRDILEEIRKHHAMRLLKETHMTAASIATILGYHDPANFGRAFKRWTNSTPTAWRQLAGRDEAKSTLQ